MKRRRLGHRPKDLTMGDVGRVLLNAAARNPQTVVDTAVAVGSAYVQHQHNARIGWLHSLKTHENAEVRRHAEALLGALAPSVGGMGVVKR